MMTIMLIDDDDKMRMLGKIDLESAGYRFVSAASGRHGLRILEHQEVGLILVNMFMPDMDDVELIQSLRQTRPTTKIVAITARKGLRNFIDMAKHLGADATLEKPFTRQELLSVVTLQLGQPSESACPKCESENVYRVIIDVIIEHVGKQRWHCATCKYEWPVRSRMSS